jgi:site-specific recombinase XerC
MQHLVNERNLSRGTQRSYRDTLALLIPFVARRIRKAVDDLNIAHVSAEMVKSFLVYIEDSRKCAISTRIAPAAIHHWPVLSACTAPSISLARRNSAITFKKRTRHSKLSGEG